MKPICYVLIICVLVISAMSIACCISDVSERNVGGTLTLYIFPSGNQEQNITIWVDGAVTYHRLYNSSENYPEKSPFFFTNTTVVIDDKFQLKVADSINGISTTKGFDLDQGAYIVILFDAGNVTLDQKEEQPMFM